MTLALSVQCLSLGKGTKSINVLKYTAQSSVTTRVIKIVSTQTSVQITNIFL